MNPSGSEKTDRGCKRMEGNEPAQVLSISLPEGGGVIRSSGMGEKFAAESVTGPAAQ